MCIAGYILSCGFLRLVFYWKPAWDVWANCIPCNLQEADVTLLRTTDEFQIYSRKKVTWISVSALNKFRSDYPIIADENSIINNAIMKPDLKVRCIQVQKIRYIWNNPEQQFQKVGSLEDSHTCSDIHAKFGSGLRCEEQEIRRLICGPNAIDIQVIPIWKLLIKEEPDLLAAAPPTGLLMALFDRAFQSETGHLATLRYRSVSKQVLNPFYVFQLFSVCLWFAEDYKEYAIAIIIMSLLSIALTVYDLRKQSMKLHRLVESHNSVRVTVCRKDKGFQELESRHLVPGDVLALTGGKALMPCDAILISGGCIVNEGMLTGESIPVTKTHLPQADDSRPWRMCCAEDYKRHVLFCGTELIQTKADGNEPARAVVLRTGFNTAKGDLVRSILYPKPMNFKLYRDALRFLMCLIVLATIGMIYAVCVFALNGEEAGEVVKKALDVITIAVPPALPAALTTGIIYTQGRLKKKGIFCISPQRINVCGQLNLICFDKEIEDSSEDHVKNGEFAHAVVIKPGPKAGNVPVEGIAILHQFPFSSALQRMSVIAQEIGGEQQVFMKGAPETVAKFCRPETMPPGFASGLQIYAARGFRVIGLAHKILQGGRQTAGLTREEVESDLTFLGLLIMENRLKAETKPVLEELSAARIRSVMVTGDNIQTAVTVAKNAGMISQTSQVILVEANELSGSPSASITWKLLEESKPNGYRNLETYIQVGGRFRSEVGRSSYHFAMSGKSYQVITQHFSYLLPKLLINGTVFARMSPGQKSSLVEEFQKLDYFVGMCGDGANDCGALKMAHAGISLSEQEASVASPFTSRTPSIECVPELIRQGRAALVTSFCMFKYMALYSTIQYLGVLLLYWQLNSFGNYQFLFQDLALTTVIGITMSLNGAYPKLVPYRPPGQLISPPLLLSVVLNILFSLCMQVFGFVTVQKQPWYAPHNIYSACLSGNKSHVENSSSAATIGFTGMEHADGREGVDNGYKSYENTTVWLLSTINCLMVALVFSKGKPFRQPVYTNYIFVLALAVQLGICVFFVFADIDGLYSQMDLVCTPTFWRISMVIMLLVTFAVSFVVEEAVIENRALWMLLKKCFQYQSKSLHKRLQRMLEQDSAWPPLNETVFSESRMIPVEDNREIFGYKTQGCRRAMCIAGYIFSCGALLLLFYWKPAWDVWANCIPCNLQEADVILLRTTDEFQKYTRKKVTWIDLSTMNLSVRDSSDSLFVADKDSVINRAIMKPELKVRSIQVQKIRYIWDLSVKQFQKVGSLDDSNSCYDIHHKFGTGLTCEEQNIRRLVCGPNAIEVEIRPIWKLLFKEILNPFYVFQAFTLTLWLSQGYIEYSMAIIILSIISIGLTVYDLRQQSVKLHDLVEEHNKVQVTACTKDEGCKKLESRYLVPGDILVLEGKKHSLPCDAILIDGGCIVDEGMLTGESIPVTKTALPHTENTRSWKTHSAEDYRRHVLFCGTEVIQTKPTGKGPVRAVVLQTGFNTAKGDLVRSILYPKPMNFKLYRDALKFIIILTLIGVLGLIYTVCVYVQHKKPVTETVVMALLLFTSSIPPAIPAALTTGIVYAQKRLKNKKIFCISPQRINICGEINLVCFDKEMEDSKAHSKVGVPDTSVIVKPGPNARNTPVDGIAILHQFPFSSGLQRMSVITQQIGKDPYDLYMKGAPEMVTSFCRPETVPADFVKELKVYTNQGFRVIALAHKALNMGKDVELDNLEREEVESDLTFLGLLIMENRLKAETKPVLEELSAARIRSVMVTGDNLQTAVTVAKSSEMISKTSKVILIEASEPEGPTPASITWQLVEDSKQNASGITDTCVNIEERTIPERESNNYHFALNGKSYQVIVKHFKSLLPKALKMAHAGISLSEQEASVASPFTSQIPNVECVPELIREGRAALVASFAVFKYLTLYGLTQCIGTALLYWQLQIFGNYQYLVQDIVITLLVCLTMSLTQAYPKLAPYRPPGQLISPPLLLSVILHTGITAVMLVCGFLFVKQQPWYSEMANHRECPPANHSLSSVSTILNRNGTANARDVPSSVLSYEDTTLWPLTTINCIILAFVFSKGKPFRKPIYTNYIFSVLLLIQLGICLFLLFADISAVYKGMLLLCTPTIWRVYILIMLFVTFCVSVFVEDVILQNRHLWLLIKKCFRFRSHSQYRKWQRKLEKDPNWPPLKRKDFAENSKNEIYINPIYEHDKEN
ncbi:Putative cation-transporting ATPase 13A4 [Chelonia mydas]|uniref:Cation-transporting ATPase n=1 Tax=Chelonia mydas TaxID=8469 RepID=M7B4N2_CHEMY|nr:Putative cation-transporting ATPase 13A4 [Chelonia mydas]